MSLPYNNKLIPYAKELRKNATPWERKLWFYFLKDYPVRFQRQKVIGDFIVDFYCHKAKLVIEVDGAGHETPQGEQKDQIRTERLEEYGLTVIRIPNRCIDNDFYRVCKYIDQVVQEKG
jgi:very-short-patch-repair endonuclease